MKRSFLSLLSTALVVSLAQAAPIKLKLERPSKVGEKAAVTAKHLTEGLQKVSMGGNELKNEPTYQSTLLEATREVLAVTDKGRATKQKFTVKSLKFSDEKGVEPEELLAGGKEVIAERKDGKLEFSVAGEPADDRTSEALGTVIEMSGESEFDPDRVFGTDKPHAVGEEWDIDMAAAIKEMKDGKYDAASSSGKAKIEKLETVEGIECARFSATMNLKPEEFPGMPEGSKLVDASFKMEVKATVPLDAAKPEFGGKMIMRVAFKSEVPTPDGGDATIEIVNEIVKEEFAKPLP